MVARRDVLPCLAEKLLSWRDLPLFLALRGFSTIKIAEKTRNSISAGIKIHPCLIAMPSSICNGGHRLGGKIRVTVRRKVAQEWALGFTKSTSKRGFLRPRRAMTQADESYGVRVTPRGLLR